MQLNSTLQAALSRTTIQPYWFMWISAKNRETGAIEESGIWNGIGPMTISVAGQTRTYAGAGGLLSIDDLVYASGTNIQTQNVALSILDPKVVEAIRVYDTTFAPIQLHLGLFDPETEGFLGVTPAFEGFVDSIDISSSMEDATASMTLASAMRNGSRPLYSRQSDADQRKRDPNDKGRLYASVAGNQTVFWGRKKKGDKEVNSFAGILMGTVLDHFKKKVQPQP